MARRLRDAAGDLLPRHGTDDALRTLVHALAEGSADPADPLCAAHLHCPPLAVATAADLAASVLNPSLDSWDQAPAASELESLVTTALAAEIYAAPNEPHTATALVTTGGTESNQLAVLLAREAHNGVQLVHGANAHHSLPRAAWLLGLPDPVVIPAPAGTMDPVALDEALTTLRGPRGSSSSPPPPAPPTPDSSTPCPTSPTSTPPTAPASTSPPPTAEASSSAPPAAPPSPASTAPTPSPSTCTNSAGSPSPPSSSPYGTPTTSPHCDTRPTTSTPTTTPEAGLPDLLGRSLRTTRRPDILKIAVTLKTLGRTGLGTLVDHVCDRATDLADLIASRPGLELYAPPTLSTVLFRPAGASDETVAAVRRTLLHDGRAVLGRARLDDRLWLKATLLNPHSRPDDLAALLKLVEGHTPR